AHCQRRTAPWATCVTCFAGASKVKGASETSQTTLLTFDFLFTTRCTINVPMTPAGSNKVGVANALPIRLVMLATALALALIASLGWYVWNSVQVLREVQVRTFRLLSLTGEIAYLNESVWISERLRVSTGEPRWMDRYQSTLARGNTALAEFQTLDPNLYGGSAVSELRSANRNLHEIESLAFMLASRGQTADAATLLIGPEYERQKQ